MTNEEEKLFWKLFALKYPEWSNRPVYSMEVDWVQYAFEKAFTRMGGRLDILELGCGSMGNLLSRFKADHRESVDAAVGIDMNIEIDEQECSENGIVLQEMNMMDGIDWPDYIL